MLSPEVLYKAACYYLLNKMEEPALKESYTALQDICDFHIALENDRHLTVEVKASPELQRKKISSIRRSQVAPLEFKD